MIRPTTLWTPSYNVKFKIGDPKRGQNKIAIVKYLFSSSELFSHLLRAFLLCQQHLDHNIDLLEDYERKKFNVVYCSWFNSI